MPDIRIDPDVCRRDGLCTMACSVGIFQQREKGEVPVLGRLDRCIGCGHCVAICPHGAITHGDYPEGRVKSTAPERLPSYDQVLELIRNRRSKRRYEDRPVERGDIEKVLEAARFAPTGHNVQPVEYVVVQDKEALATIGRLTVDGLEKMLKPFASPVGRFIMRFVVGKRRVEGFSKFAGEMGGIAEIYRGGKDIVLNDAPCVIFFCADSDGGFPGVECSLALQNATLAAEALGLGCFYTGFVLAACMRGRSIAGFLGLPETHQVFGGLAMGYPRLSFKKWPERKPVRATWV